MLRSNSMSSSSDSSETSKSASASASEPAPVTEKALFRASISSSIPVSESLPESECDIVRYSQTGLMQNRL
ncbi:hypothetical protein Hanom_Chr02g00152991 [Helianthus anomalus]